MNEQLKRISDKINQLKTLDDKYLLFGSETHQYKLNPTISMDKIHEFEKIYNIIIPKDYVAFITLLGNGGVGPYYGLEPFENGLFDNLDNKNPDYLLNPSKPFLHNEPWNLEFSTMMNEKENEEAYEKAYEQFEKQYFDNEQMNGVIAICNFGCGVNLHLVVNGQAYGNIWTDDRANGNGIYPSCELGNENKLSFLNWYELWLDISLKEIMDV